MSVDVVKWRAVADGIWVDWWDEAGQVAGTTLVNARSVGELAREQMRGSGPPDFVDDVGNRPPPNEQQQQLIVNRWAEWYGSVLETARNRSR